MIDSKDTTIVGEMLYYVTNINSLTCNNLSQLFYLLSVFNLKCESNIDNMIDWCLTSSE